MDIILFDCGCFVEAPLTKSENVEMNIIKKGSQIKRIKLHDFYRKSIYTGSVNFLYVTEKGGDPLTHPSPEMNYCKQTNRCVIERIE